MEHRTCLLWVGHGLVFGMKAAEPRGRKVSRWSQQSLQHDCGAE